MKLRQGFQALILLLVAWGAQLRNKGFFAKAVSKDLL
jgi:hypothetical protein